MIRTPDRDLPRRRRPLRGIVAVALCTVATLPTCGGDEEPGRLPAAAAAPADTPVVAPRPVGRRYERNVAFLTTGSDSALAVPWLVTAATRAGGVDRSARAWLVRDGTWEAFVSERWSTPPTRAPWRILPQGPMRLVVGQDESLERLVYAAGARELEVRMGAPLVEWTGRGGETFRVLEGDLVLAGSRSTGLILDMGRSSEAGAATGGDWAFLVGRRNLQVVLHARISPGNPFRGWARLDFRELDFAELEVTWSETRPFERARREVPVVWALATPDGRLEGRLEVRSAQLEAGEGEGPQLPVDAIFEVAGTLTIEGVDHAVRGLFRHTQG